MQREISNEVFLGNTVSAFNDVGKSSAIDRTVSNYDDAREKFRKRELISTGQYEKDIAKFIPGLLELKLQGMLEDIDTREKTVHPSYTDMEQLDFQIRLRDNYYIILNSIHICFLSKIRKKANTAQDIDSDMLTLNNFFAHFIKEISITKYGSDKKLIPAFFPYEAYKYANSMLKHLPEKALKTMKKLIYIVKKQFTTLT